MIEENLARLNILLSKQITNIEVNKLLSWDDKENVAKIIMYLCQGIQALKFALTMDEANGEEWREQ